MPKFLYLVLNFYLKKKQYYEKPNAKYYIDDKAIRFLNWEMVMEDIRDA